MKQYIAPVGIAAGVVGIGMLVTAGLLDGAWADRAYGALVGGVVGAGGYALAAKNKVAGP